MTELYNGNGECYGYELERDEIVIFPDGTKHKWTESQWNSKHNAFVSFFDKDGNNREEPLFSNEVIKVERKKREYKKQTNTSKMKQIFPCGETEKAYQVEDGSNGCITRGNMKLFYKFYAKSICIEEDGKIYAPVWA